jgi:hypothetical protein
LNSLKNTPSNSHVRLTDMQSRQVLEHLKDLAERLGVEIIYQKLGDRSKPVEDQITILARGLSAFDTEEVYLFPYIREVLDNARGHP